MLNNQDQATGLRKLMQSSRPRILGFLSTGNEAQSVLLFNLAQALQTMQVDVVVANTQCEHRGQLQNDYMPNALLSMGIHTLDLDIASFEDATASILGLAECHDVVLLNACADELHSLQMQGLRLINPISIIEKTELVIQVTNRASSIKGAYMMMKSICERFGRQKFSVLVHDVSEKVALHVFTNLAETAKQFMQVELTLIGVIPTDIYLNKAIQLGRSVIDAFPMAAATKAFEALANQIHYAPSNANGASNSFYA